MYRIHTGDKAYSSWSLRGWLLLDAFGLAYEDVPVRMYTPEFEALRAAMAPARTVPVVEWEGEAGTRRVWDTLAIAETLHERHPEAGIWPARSRDRTIARSLAAEMHSSFQALRNACPMHLNRKAAPLRELPEAVAADVARIDALWAWALAETGGPWLGGPRFSAADAFYAPVAFRFEEYALATPKSGDYAGRLRAHPSVRKWQAMAVADPRRIAHYEVD